MSVYMRHMAAIGVWLGLLVALPLLGSAQSGGKTGRKDSAARHVVAPGPTRAAGGGVGAAGSDSVVGETARRRVITSGGQPNTQTVAPVRRGFDLWVLFPVLLLIAFAYIVWKKYMDIKDELRARKTEMRSFNENYFNAGRGGPGSSGSGPGAGSRAGGLPDRKEVERLIANSNVLAELNEAISKLQLRVSQLEGVRGGTAGGAMAGVPGSAVGAASAPGGGGREKIRPKPADGAGSGAGMGPGAGAKQDGVSGDVFYMAGPVNNYFPNSAKSMTKDNTVYKFKLGANKQEAEYELHTGGAPIMEIVQLAESYIKAACDEENLPTYPVKNIVTKKSGKAILEGDKWVIKSKALIRYE